MASGVGALASGQNLMLDSRANWPVSAYCGRRRPLPRTPQMGEKADLHGSPETAQTPAILLKKSLSPQADAIYLCRMKHLLRSKADLDGEASALGYILGC